MAQRRSWVWRMTIAPPFKLRSGGLREVHAEAGNDFPLVQGLVNQIDIGCFGAGREPGDLGEHQLEVLQQHPQLGLDRIGRVHQQPGGGEQVPRLAGLVFHRLAPARFAGQGEQQRRHPLQVIGRYPHERTGFARGSGGDRGQPRLHQAVRRGPARRLGESPESEADDQHRCERQQGPEPAGWRAGRCREGGGLDGLPHPVQRRGTRDPPGLLQLSQPPLDVLFVHRDLLIYRATTPTSASRSRALASKSRALLVPCGISSISPISRWVNPSMSCNTTGIRSRSGSRSSSRASRSRRWGSPGSSGPATDAASSSSASRARIRLSRRNPVITDDTATEWSQVENADSPRYCSSRWNARTKVSWVYSRASSSSPTNRKIRR